MSGNYVLMDTKNELTMVYMKQTIPGREKEIHTELRKFSGISAGLSKKYNVPKTAVVETNAMFSRDYAAPVTAGAMPDAVLELTMPDVVNHERILEAALNYDFNLALKALMDDKGGWRKVRLSRRQ